LLLHLSWFGDTYRLPGDDSLHVVSFSNFE
jgi:hypothetical protein